MGGDEYLAWEIHFSHTPPQWYQLTVLIGGIFQRLLRVTSNKKDKIPELYELYPWLDKPRRRKPVEEEESGDDKNLALMQQIFKERRESGG